jgi:hypothetical protein
MNLDDALRVIADDFADGSGVSAEEIVPQLLTVEGAKEWIADEREDEEFDKHSEEWKQAAVVIEAA